MFKIITDYEFADFKYFGPECPTVTREFAEFNTTSYKNLKFNAEVNSLFNDVPIWICDFGCGDGGWIEDAVNDGHQALGIDGNYVCRKYLIRSWKNIPNNLLNADISKPFKVIYSDNCRFRHDMPTVQFDLITSFEFFEHLYPEDIEQALKNLDVHLKPGGYFIAGISPRDQGGHHSIHDRAWWLSQFNQIGLIDQSQLYGDLNKNFPHFEHDSHQFIMRKL